MPNPTLPLVLQTLLFHKTSVLTQVSEIMLTLGLVAGAGYIEDRFRGAASIVVFASTAFGMVGGSVLMVLVFRLVLTIFARLPKNETNKQRTVAFCVSDARSLLMSLSQNHPTKRKCLTVYPDCKDSAGKSRIPLGVACFAASIPTTKTWLSNAPLQFAIGCR